jgi:hypothetical protein
VVTSDAAGHKKSSSLLLLLPQSLLSGLRLCMR